jgi:hypothetical protein
VPQDLGECPGDADYNVSMVLYSTYRSMVTRCSVSFRPTWRVAQARVNFAPLAHQNHPQTEH